MKAVFFSKNLPKTYEIQDFEIPQPGADEILIKNVAVASNPKDWKLVEWMPDWQAVEGNDVAGYIEAVGSDVTLFKKGQKVAAFSKMMTSSKYGAYAEYTVAPAHTAWPVADSTSFEDAATLPLAMMTACIGLFRRLGLPEPPASGKGTSEGVIVINGASSSVGAFAVQLAKRAGYSVVGIAGGSGHYAKKLGADYIVDYRDKSSQDLGESVKQAISSSGKTLVGIYDAVSTESSVEMLAYEVLQPSGGKITTVLPAYDEGKGLKVDNVKVIRTMVGTAHSDDADFAKLWYRRVGKWLDEGSFKANQVKIMPNGLDSVPDGMTLLKEGKVHAEKLVYRIADSKCIQSA